MRFILKLWTRLFSLVTFPASEVLLLLRGWMVWRLDPMSICFEKSPANPTFF
jgi:hypothetical protein